MEASTKDIDDAETKDNRWCTTSYVFLQKYPRYYSMTSDPGRTKDPRYFTKKLPLCFVQNPTV
jgi:hypothetical protein